MKLRTATYSDYNQIKELHNKNDIKILEEYEWVNFWKKNPLIKQNDESYPIGWVLIEQGKIVGYLGNIVKEFLYKKKIIIVACSHAWIVETKYKLESLTLINIYFAQKNIDVFITTTPNKTAEKLFLRYGAKKIPIKNYNENLFQILNVDKFMESFLRYKKIPTNKFFRFIIVSFFKIIFFNKLNFWKKYIQKNELKIHKYCDSSFGFFWEKYKSKNTKFVLSKSLSWLDWHTNYLKDVFFISISENNQIKGYALCCKRNNDKYDLRRISILDIITIEDKKEIYLSLIKECIKESQKRGYHIIDMIGTNDTKKKMFSNFKTFKRKTSNFLFYYYSNDPELLNILVNDKVWDPSLLDGDSFLI